MFGIGDGGNALARKVIHNMPNFRQTDRPVVFAS
jgi:hypothetical protein